MILMTKNGAYMHCYNAREVKVAESKGWSVAEPPKAPAKKKAAKK